MRTTVQGEIRNGGHTLRCSTCGRTKGLTIYGVDRARVECPCGADFAPATVFNPVRLLEFVERATSRAHA